MLDNKQDNEIKEASETVEETVAVEATTEVAPTEASVAKTTDDKKPETKNQTRKSFGGGRKPHQGGGNRRENHTDSEYEQQVLDLARVTRVMAGGKRMRFRACIGLGNKSGKVGIGLAKGADVTLAITKAVNQAKKNMIEVPLTASASIPHEITQKYGASLILLRPAKQGRGIICGGVVRMIAELAGIQNITGKILGTNNNVSNAKCTIEALSNLKPLKTKKKDIKSGAKAEEAKIETK